MIREHMKGSFSDDSEIKTPDNSYSENKIEIQQSDKLTEEEKEFLKDIADHPLAGVSSRYKRIALSIEKGNEIKITLIEKDVLKPVSIPIHSGRILLLEPTQKGKEALKQIGINYQNGRLGGVEHEYWKMKVSYYYRNKGFTVKHEHPISQGKTVDLLIEKDGLKTAVEIETRKSDFIENIRKCLDFSEIICVATSPEVEKKIREKLRKANMERDKIEIVGCKRFS